MSDENERRLEEEIREKGIEIKSTKISFLRNGSKFQEGHFDYDSSKERCSLCNGKGHFRKTGKGYIDGVYQPVELCTAITMPCLEDLNQTPDELKKELGRLCSRAGEIRESKIGGYLPGPYVECQKLEEEE